MAAAIPKAGDFLRDETAATAIEYAMIASGVALAIAATVYSTGATVLTQLYNKVANAME